MTRNGVPAAQRGGRTAPPNVLDLFSGCGAMSKGFEQAGYRIVAGCEMDSDAAGTFGRNHPGAVMIEGDLTREDTRRHVCDVFAGVRCDVVIGGIPCKAFTKSQHRDPNDPRGKLYVPFFDVVSRLMPLAVVIENVPDLLTYRHADGTLARHRIAALFASLGYAAGHLILNAADFAVPQRRRRAFILGWRRGGCPDPRPTHDAKGSNGLPRWVTVRDAIGDLEDAPENSEWSHEFTRHGRKVAERFAGIPIGGKGAIHYNEGYYRNPPGLACRTLRGGSWPIHYRHHRVLTVREAARIQGFDDGFLFGGSKAAQMLQVGNAVPPPLARAVAIAVREALLA